MSKVIKILNNNTNKNIHVTLYNSTNIARTSRSTRCLSSMNVGARCSLLKSNKPLIESCYAVSDGFNKLSEHSIYPQMSTSSDGRYSD